MRVRERRVAAYVQLTIKPKLNLLVILPVYFWLFYANRFLMRCVSSCVFVYMNISYNMQFKFWYLVSYTLKTANKLHVVKWSVRSICHEWIKIKKISVFSFFCLTHDKQMLKHETEKNASNFFASIGQHWWIDK